MFPLGGTSWGDTTLLLPELEAEGDAVHAVTGRPVPLRTLKGRPALRLAELFAELPVSLRPGAAPA